MAATIEIQVKADIQQASAGLKNLLSDLGKLELVSDTTASSLQGALSKMTSAVKGFSGADFSTAFVKSSNEIVSSALGISQTAKETASSVIKSLGGLPDFKINVDASSLTNLQSLVDSVKNNIKGARVAPISVPVQVDKVEIPKVGVPVIKVPVEAEKITIPPVNAPVVKVPVEAEAVTIPKVSFPPVEIPVDAAGFSKAVDNLGNSIKPLAIQLNTDVAQANAQKLQQTIETLEGKLGARKEFIKIETDVTKLAVLNKEIQDLEKEITRLKNIGKSGFDALGNKVDVFGNALQNLNKRNGAATQSLVNLSRVAQDAPFGFIGIANNINPLLESFQRLRTESGSTGGALKSLGSGLLGGGGLGLAVGVVSGLLAAFGDKLFKTSSAVEQNAEKVKKAKQALDDFAASLDDISQSRLKGAQNAQEELVKLQLLYSASQNQNIALSDRKKLVDQLQEQYPKTFRNFSDEIILAGGAKDAYLKLASAILATSRAQAQRETLVDIQKQLLGAEEQTASALKDQLAVIRLINKARASGKKETSVSATGEERLTSFGAQMVDLEQTLKDKTDAVNKAYQVKNDLLKRATNLSEDLNTTIEKDPTVLLGDPAGKLKQAANSDASKFNFFDKFFEVTPKTASEKAKQTLDMYHAALEFALKNQDLIVGLDKIIAAPDKEKTIEQGKIFWDNYQKGLIKFKPPKVDLGQLQIEVNATPSNDTTDFSGAIKAFQNTIIGLQESANIDVNIDIEGVKKADKAFKELKKTIGDWAKSTGSQIGSSLGAPVEKAFANILNGKLQEALNKGLSPEALQKMSEGLANGLGLLSKVLGGLQGGFETFFESVITGSGNAFQKLGQAISGMITKLIASLAAMAAISGLISLIIPGAGSFKNVFSGIIGSSLGIKPFAAGGLAFGPTLGLVGEGIGTSRSNPEVIAPLDKLKNFLQPQAGLQRVIVEGRISGKDLLLVQSRQQGFNSRNL